MEVSGWGRYPRQQAALLLPRSARELPSLLEQGAGIAAGMHRSYGDSALAERVFSSRAMNHFLAFDEASGELRCEAGVTLADIMDAFIPRGWFLPVVPGTRFVSVGGAIASDIHGKNHHIDGCFSQHLRSLTLMQASGEQLVCSPSENPQLFRATCGGMGLTGIITEATLRLRRHAAAAVEQTTYKAGSLAQALALFEDNADASYSVAWIDCLASGRKQGRSLVMLGEHASVGADRQQPVQRLSVPTEMPRLLLNRYSIAAFNSLYFHRQGRHCATRRVSYDSYFFPLDGIGQWNRLYGRQGFVQYQCVLPKASARRGLSKLLDAINRRGAGSFLAVLKLFGAASENYLSFPQEGYTLAVDFKVDDGLWGFLDELDRQVLDYGGRVYLAKDARLSEKVFKQMYPAWEQLAEIRALTGADKRFSSRQSQRLGI